MKSGGAKNGSIVSAWDLWWELCCMKSIGKLMGGT